MKDRTVQYDLDKQFLENILKGKVLDVGWWWNFLIQIK